MLSISAWNFRVLASTGMLKVPVPLNVWLISNGIPVTASCSWENLRYMLTSTLILF